MGNKEQILEDLRAFQEKIEAGDYDRPNGEIDVDMLDDELSVAIDKWLGRWLAYK